MLPETGEQTEVGVKFQPNGFDGHFGVALFDLKRTNVLTTDPNSVPPNLQTQDGEVTSRGIELEAVANVAPGLKVLSSFTTYDIFVSKDDNPLAGRNGADQHADGSSPRAGPTIPSSQAR